MFCNHCGAKLIDGVSVCPYCHRVQPFLQQPVIYGYVNPKIPGRGLGISGMIMGIIGLVYCLVALSTAINFTDMYYEGTKLPTIIEVLLYSAFSILALSLAGAGRSKGYRNGVSSSGVIMGIIGLGVYFISLVIVFAGA